MATKVKPSRLNVSGTPQVGQVPVYVDEDSFQWGAGGGGGTGDVTGPASSTDGDIVLFDGVTGKLIKDSGVGLSSKLDASALSDNNYGGAWENDSTHTPTKRALYDKIHTMDVEIGNKAADNTVVKLSGNQTIAGTKTFSTSPVVPSKSTAATNSGTEIATEAQVKLVADDVATINGKIPSAATSSNQLADKNYVDNGISGKQDALTLPATPTQGNLVTWGADNKTLLDGGAIPTGVPSGGNNGDVLTNVSGTPTWQAPAAGGITNDTTGTTSTVTGIWAGSETEYTNLGTKSGSVLYFTF